jgi:hypothetical protein
MVGELDARHLRSCFHLIVFAILWLGSGSYQLGWAMPLLRISPSSLELPTPIHCEYLAKYGAEGDLALSPLDGIAEDRVLKMKTDAFAIPPADSEPQSKCSAPLLTHDSCGGPGTELAKSVTNCALVQASNGFKHELSEAAAILMSPTASDQPRDRVQWASLMRASAMYLGVMHSFRIATEPSTRAGLHNSVFGGYFKALGAMHGWSDGDGYYENYLGHPIEGGVSAYAWIHNDPRYRTVEFGLSRDYWMSRLRGFGYAWAFSEQFEVGLMSEASIGQIQRYCCAYGFVDHVITPVGATAWVLGGDILDRYVVRPVEDHTHNAAVRAIMRSALNPAESFANLMALQYPWHRTNPQESANMMASSISGNPRRRKRIPQPCPPFQESRLLLPCPR